MWDWECVCSVGGSVGRAEALLSVSVYGWCVWASCVVYVCVCVCNGLGGGRGQQVGGVHPGGCV